jgi:hypothetical protein
MPAQKAPKQTGGECERPLRSSRRTTVNLTANAVQALEQAQESTGDSQTDCINRSLPVYAYLMKARAEGWTFCLKQDGRQDVYVEIL